MVNNISEARNIYQQRVGRRDLLNENLLKATDLLEKARKDQERVTKARAVVQIVAKATQEKIEFYISNLVTMALASVFPDPYEVSLRFVERRNVTEADLVFLKNGNEINNILDFGGGGAADVADFALRISLWSLKKTRPVFIFDEPDKFLHSAAYQERASDMMHSLCERMGIQIIMVSDQPNIIAAADKVIRLDTKNGSSFVSSEAIYAE